VKAHHYGAMNPLAQFQKEITLEKALASQVISWPLKLYDACPLSDGSAAVILASEEVAKKLTDTPVWIRGVGYSSDSANLSRRQDYVGLRASVEAAKRAYAMSKATPDAVDVATCHDCFTIAELMAYEDLGFCKKGEGAKMIREGQTEVGGRIPVNLDGGLKAKGHPIGATGVSMTVEITQQLRNEAGKHQAPIRSGIGLVHNVGGTGHYAYVTVLSRD
jgi:acetyl-CoA C-acetyltransferase